MRWILIGDDGQHDVKIYSRIASLHPERVIAILIRQLSTGEHLLVGTIPSSTSQNIAESPTTQVEYAADGFGFIKKVNSIFSPSE
jgi:phosphatidate phosphatase APP1